MVTPAEVTTDYTTLHARVKHFLIADLTCSKTYYNFVALHFPRLKYLPARPKLPITLLSTEVRTEQKLPLASGGKQLRIGRPTDSMGTRQVRDGSINRNGPTKEHKKQLGPDSILPQLESKYFSPCGPDQSSASILRKCIVNSSGVGRHATAGRKTAENFETERRAKDAFEEQQQRRQSGWIRSVCPHIELPLVRPIPPIDRRK